MRSRKVTGALAAVAVSGALVFGGCGGGNDASTSGSKPASQTTGDSMKHEDAMKDDGAAKGNSGAMKDDGAMKQDHAMKDDDGAMHDQSDDHGGAMKEG